MTTRFGWVVAVEVTFVVAEAVCRLVLHLDDSLVPLVVFPLCAAAAVGTIARSRK